MAKDEIKSNQHELDLDLIRQHGYLDNTEVELSKKDFLTDEKVEVGNKIASQLFRNSDKKFIKKK